jgi:hypothetical protein
MLGRPPQKNRLTSTYSILFPNPDFIRKIDEIARSQSTSRRQYIISVLEKAIDDYEKEGQTGLLEFAEGAEQTDNLEFMRVTHLLANQKSVKKKTIYQKFKAAGFTHPQLMTFTEKAVKYLTEKGVKVWDW